MGLTLAVTCGVSSMDFTDVLHRLGCFNAPLLRGRKDGEEKLLLASAGFARLLMLVRILRFHHVRFIVCLEA